MSRRPCRSITKAIPTRPFVALAAPCSTSATPVPKRLQVTSLTAGPNDLPVKVAFLAKPDFPETTINAIRQVSTLQALDVPSPNGAAYPFC